MKKLLTSFLALCALAFAGHAHAQPAGYVYFGTNTVKGPTFIGNISAQHLRVDPSVKLAEFTTYYPTTDEFVTLSVECRKPDVLFHVELDANGDKRRVHPFMVPFGTLGYDASIYACTAAYMQQPPPPAAPQRQRQRERLTPA
jgi:hypothetical protein